MARSKSAGVDCEALEGARDEGDAEGAAGQLLHIERDELNDDGDAEGGDREIVRAQPQRERADEEPRPAPEATIAASQPTTIGSAKPPRRPVARRRRQERRGIGADGDETGDADIEQAGLSPLQVEAEADDAR